MVMRLWNILMIGLLTATTGMPTASARESEVDYPLIEAGRIAYAHFSKELQSCEDKTTKLGAFLSRMENYQLTLRQTPDLYIVTIDPLLIDGETIYGGGGEYKISKESLRVVDFKKFK